MDLTIKQCVTLSLLALRNHRYLILITKDYIYSSKTLKAERETKHFE